MIGNEIYNFAKQLWPINRSLTGEGVRETLENIRQLNTYEFIRKIFVLMYFYNVCSQGGYQLLLG